MTDIMAGQIVVRDIGVVIFDKDGTLIDLHTYWSAMVKMRAENICERLGLVDDQIYGLMDSMGVDVKNGRIKPEGPVGIKKREIVLGYAAQYLSNNGINISNSDIEAIFATADLESLNRLDEIIKSLPGMHKLIDDLHRADVKVAIATTDRTERASLALRHLGINDRVACVVGADMVRKPKPDPEMIEIICEMLDVSVSRSVMVGDTTIDLEMGNNANVAASIGVESGLTCRVELEGLSPIVVKDISYLKVVR